MRIGLFGNMNNNFFGLVRYLRDLGHDAELLYSNDADHFLPHCDAYTLDYQEYCREVNWNPTTFYTTPNRDVFAQLSRFDYTIVSGYAVSFFNRVGRAADIYVPYGSDIYKYAFLDQSFPLRTRVKSLAQRIRNTGAPRVDVSAGTVHRNLREGIRHAKNVMLAPTNPDFEERLDALQITGRRCKVSVPFVYAPQYDPAQLHRFYARSHWYEEFKRVRDAFEIVVFHHSRHIWKTYANAFSFKGNDKLIRGFAEFVRAAPATRACLVMLEYGPDVAESKALVRQLGIQQHVRWFPRMYRKDIMIGLHLADVATGEFDKSYLVFGALMEAMVMGKPVVHFRDDRLYDSDYPDLYPVLNARAPLEIAAALHRYRADPQGARVIGEAARQWFLKHIVAEPLAEIDRMIAGEAANAAVQPRTALREAAVS